MSSIVRTVLTGLTTRGRSFLAAGATTIGCAVLLGEHGLLHVGILLLALPLLSAVAVVRAHYRLGCVRRLEPTRVVAGHSARVRLRIDNISRLPTGLLLIEDCRPYALGSRSRFVVERLEARGVRELSYQVRSDVRGCFTLGPLTVRLADPFGLVELTRSFAATDTLTVTPARTELPRIRVAGDWAHGGAGRARAVAAAGEDDMIPREYRHGDDLRRVHWRSTARYGALMVRREEQHWHSSGVLLLDTRSGAHRGAGPSSSFEWAVSAAASIGTRLTRDGYRLRFLVDTGEVAPETDGGGEFEGRLLDALAVVRPSRSASLSDGVTAAGSTGAGLVVAVLGALDEADTRALASLTFGGASRVAILCDTPTWTARTPTVGTGGTSAGYGSPTATLTAAGWRVVSASAGTDLAAAWTLVGSPRGKAPEEPLRPRATGGAP